MALRMWILDVVLKKTPSVVYHTGLFDRHPLYPKTHEQYI